MSIYSKEKVVAELETFFDVKLNPLAGKRIFYNGKLTNGKKFWFALYNQNCIRMVLHG